MTSFDDTYLKHIDGDVDWSQTEEYGRGKHAHTLPKYVFCWICMEEVDRLEIGQHHRGQRHKHQRLALQREARTYVETIDDSRLCGGCPALLSSDYTCICRLGWFRWYDNRWYRNLFGYYNPETGQIDEMYPLDAREENLAWEVVALRPNGCKRQMGGKHIEMPHGRVLPRLFSEPAATIQDDLF